MALLEGLHQAITAQGQINFDHVIFCPVSNQTDTASKKGTLSQCI
jgi:hypothetical protein